MQRQKVVLNNDHSVGLGDNLCMLSMLANLPCGIDLYVNNDHNTYDRLVLYKRIFRIPDQQLKILPTTENGNYNNVGWPVKLFTEYFQPAYVNAGGQIIQTRTKNEDEKKCIAIAANFVIDPELGDKWPYCRHRPLEYWARIFSWIKGMGFDVITVDEPYHNLESKVEMLAKHCRAIISYEGGMAHLAHMLKLPCFLIDWRLPSPSTTLGQFHCEFVHMTDSVYIIRNDEELFLWNHSNFTDRIKELREGKTNNRIMNGECKIQFAGPGIRGKIKVVNKANHVLLDTDGIFGDTKVTELLEKYYK